MLIVLGGRTYPVPRQVIEMPKGEGLIDRATSANPRRTSAPITNISDAFISAPPTWLVCAGRLDRCNSLSLAKNRHFANFANKPLVSVIACYRQLRIRWVQCVHETVTVTARQCVIWVFHLVCAQRCDVDTENRTLVSSVLARLVSRHCQHGCQWRALG